MGISPSVQYRSRRPRVFEWRFFSLANHAGFTQSSPSPLGASTSGASVAMRTGTIGRLALS